MKVVKTYSPYTRILFFLTCFIFSLCFSLNSCKSVYEYEVNNFDLNEYQNYLYTYQLPEEFNNIGACGKIESGNDAVSKAKSVFEMVYGKNALGTQGPYNVYHDSTCDAWLVTGTTLFSKGSGAHIIFNGADGGVLAVWNYKF